MINLKSLFCDQSQQDDYKYTCSSEREMTIKLEYSINNKKKKKLKEYTTATEPNKGHIISGEGRGVSHKMGVLSVCPRSLAFLAGLWGA